MISKNELKYIRSLQVKKFREEEKLFIAEGPNSIEAGMESSYNCTLVLYTEKFHANDPELIILAESRGIRTERISETDFARVSDSVHPQGILGVYNIPEKRNPEFSRINGGVVYLDNISDPGNVGTIVRTCDWFGIKHLMLSGDSADVFNPKTIRSSAGSVFNVDIYRDVELPGTSRELKANGFSIQASDLEGENIYDYSFPRKSLLIFSNEANGLSVDLADYIDTRIFIPGSGKAESLNVASAAAVILYQYAAKAKKK